MRLVSGISGSSAASAAERSWAPSAAAGLTAGAQSLKKSPALSERANNFSTASRNAWSVLQASSRNRRRCAGSPISSAWQNTAFSRWPRVLICARIYLSSTANAPNADHVRQNDPEKFRRLRLLADVAKQPSPGIGPLPIERALGKPYSLSNFLIAQAAKEFQHDH